MNYLKYSIAGVTFELGSQNEIVVNDNFQAFMLEKAEADYIAEFVMVSELSLPEGELVESNIDFNVIKDIENKYYRIFHDRNKSPYAVAFWNKAEKYIKIEYLLKGKEFVNETKNTILHLGIEALFLRKSRIILHSACVKTEYGGILFTGPSGIGKSTQAELWEKYRNAELINGDRTIIAVNKNNSLAYGSPYAGSSRCYKNDSCNIGAIIKLVQSNDNTIEKMSLLDAFTTLYAECIVNDWCSEDVKITAELLNELVSHIPVYRLYCTPDERAVKKLEEILKGEM